MFLQQEPHARKEGMHIGCYIGSVLVRKLLEHGYEVKCLDSCFSGQNHWMGLAIPTHQRDYVRWFNPQILKDVDAVIDLAALSNDPSGELDPSKTLDMNYLGRGQGC